MSLVSPAQVKVLHDPGIPDQQLQEVIDREEAWLAARIGPLAGVRTVTYYPTTTPDRRGAPLGLPRRAPADGTGLTITDAGTLLDPSQYRLFRDGWGVRRLGLTAYWAGAVAVVYTPDDVREVESAIIELVKVRVTDTGYSQETRGAVSYSRGNTDAEGQRAAILRALRPRHGAHTVYLRSSLYEPNWQPVPTP